MSKTRFGIALVGFAVVLVGFAFSSLPVMVLGNILILYPTAMAALDRYRDRALRRIDGPQQDDQS